MPSNPIEWATIEALVTCGVKLARLDVLEMQAMQRAMAPDDGEPARRLPSLATLDRYRGRILKERRDTEARLAELQEAHRMRSGGRQLQPQALRYLADLADLAERQTGEPARPDTAPPANHDGCTIEPGSWQQSADATDQNALEQDSC